MAAPGRNLPGLKNAQSRVVCRRYSEARDVRLEFNEKFGKSGFVFTGYDASMKIVLFGATGMVGSGVLKECLDSNEVESILAVGRNTADVKHEKFTEIIHDDFFHYSDIEDALAGYDACFFCLGVSAMGMSETEYTRLTYEITMKAARTLVRLNPEMTFCYLSGAGADSTEKGRVMWARVRGRLENHLLELPFKSVYVFRPAYIQPVKGVKSKTALYGFFYRLLGPFYGIWKRVAPGYVTNTASMGLAMINVVRGGWQHKIVATNAINALAERAGGLR